MKTKVWKICIKKLYFETFHKWVMETPEVRGLSIFLNAQIDEKGMKNALMAMEKHSESKVNKWQVTLPLYDTFHYCVL